MKSKLHEAVANAPELAEATRERYLRDLDTFIEFAGDDPKAWTPGMLKAYEHRLADRLAPASVKRSLSSVRSALRLIEDPHGLTDEQVAKLLATCERDPQMSHGVDAVYVADLRDRAIITLALECGLQSSELRALRIESVLVELDGKLTRAARDALAPWMVWLLGFITEGALFCPLQTTRPHGAISGAGIQKMLDARGERAGIGHVDVQMLRRVHARRTK